MPEGDGANTRRPSWSGLAPIVALGVVLAAGLVLVVGRVVLDEGPSAVVQRGAAADGYTVWERNADGTPVRWDPCREIVLVHALGDGPVDLAPDLDEAVTRLRAATGLDLIVAGSVDERPSADRAPYQPGRYGDGWAPVLVAWADPHEGGLPLRDIDRGVGMPIAVGPEGDRTYVTGQVVLNATRSDLEPGFGDRATSWGAILLHELAHVLGLGHVDDPSQLMHVHPGSGPVELGAGDRAGLAAVGAEGGCRPVPEAREVEVVEPPASPHP